MIMMTALYSPGQIIDAGKHGSAPLKLIELIDVLPTNSDDLIINERWYAIDETQNRRVIAVHVSVIENGVRVPGDRPWIVTSYTGDR